MNQTSRKTIEQVVQECGRYPLEAFEFVRAGLNFTVEKLHGAGARETEQSCHVTGQQLCMGLRQFAIQQYGVMAKAVLSHWRVYRTEDFGRIVFALIEAKLMQKTEEDSVEDFVDVYDFRAAFEPTVRPARPGKATFSL